MYQKLITALVLCAAASGCSFHEADRGPGSSFGTHTTSWSLDGSYAPDVCAYYVVDRVDVGVFDYDGFLVADAQPYCEDFGVSFDLYAGRYSTEVTLLDFDGYAVSDTIVVDASVLRDTEVFIDIDFPGSTIW